MFVLQNSRTILKMELGQSKEGKTPSKINQITIVGANAILTCLQEQLDYALNTDIDKRLGSVFLATVEFDKKNIERSVCTKILQVALTNNVRYSMS